MDTKVSGILKTNLRVPMRRELQETGVWGGFVLFCFFFVFGFFGDMWFIMGR